ncbi:protein kinase [Streptomyces sp. NPDC127172]|uniref:serine/threonine-protein kinase n=1 Tax=Streptomyces sp. NPDC127172 TaxID=3345382 RepID=UPI003628C2BD
MGSVWRGYDAVLDRPVAVKLIRQQAVTSPQLAVEFVKRFRREARITAKIQHPGVPQVYDAVLDDDLERLYLVMELVDGVPLNAYLRPGLPSLPISWAVAVAAQVATVLSYAHDVPVIHRDLKPSNIIIARDGTVKVLDFGIAAILRTDVTKLTATGSPIGTYAYMAPEQVRGGSITPQTDLYALGCVLHELLSGIPPFTVEGNFALMTAQVQDLPTPLRDLRAEVPTALEELVLHLLEKAPEARPADVQEVYERLRPYLPSPGDTTPTPGAEGWGSAPDPTSIYRHPYAPRARAAEAAQVGQPASQHDAEAARVSPAATPDAVRAEIDEVIAHAVELAEEERFAQAAEVIAEMIAPAARALGSHNKRVLNLRRTRAAIQLTGGDYRAALPEFDDLADVYAHVSGPTSKDARGCRAQAARCLGELGQMTEALAGLRDVLTIVRSAESDATEEALVLRRDIGMLLLAQNRAVEARGVLEPLHTDLEMVEGPDHELTIEVAEVLAIIRRLERGDDQL